MQWVQRTFVGDGSLFMRSSLSPSALYGQCSETNFVKHGVLLLQLLGVLLLLLHCWLVERGSPAVIAVVVVAADSSHRLQLLLHSS